MVRRSILGALALVLLGLCGLTAWSLVDRTSAFTAICEAGLPNLSRPAEIDPDKLGCAILAPKSTYRGLLVTGFEASNFSSPDFPKVEGRWSEDDGRAWYNCPTSGCDASLDKQLDREYLQSCFSDRLFQTGFASIEVEGWVTVSEGQFGHLGAYPREFYASRVLSVGPPPKRVIEDRIAGARSAELCDDPIDRRP